MQKRRQRQKGFLSIETPLCRICGAPDPRPVDVPGGRICMCGSCIESMEHGRLDVKLEIPSEPRQTSGRMPAYGSPLVMASYDGGRWNKVSYTALVKGGRALVPVCEGAKPDLYRAMVNASAEAAAERRDRGGKPKKAPRRGYAVLVDGAEVASITEAARLLRTNYTAVYKAVNEGGGTVCGASVMYADPSRPATMVPHADARGKARPLFMDGVPYASIKDAADACGVAGSTLKRWLDAGLREARGHVFEEMGGTK